MTINKMKYFYTIQTIIILILVFTIMLTYPECKKEINPATTTIDCIKNRCTIDETNNITK